MGGTPRRVIRVGCGGGQHTITVTDDYVRLDDHTLEDLEASLALNYMGETSAWVPACVIELASNPVFERRLPILLADGSVDGSELYSLIIDAWRRHLQQA